MRTSLNILATVLVVITLTSCDPNNDPINDVEPVDTTTVINPTVSTSDLEAAIAAADTVTEALYTTESMNDLTSAVEYGESVLTSEDQELIDEATAGITEAIESLVVEPELFDYEWMLNDTLRDPTDRYSLYISEDMIYMSEVGAGNSFPYIVKETGKDFVILTVHGASTIDITLRDYDEQYVHLEGYEINSRSYGDYYFEK